LSTHKPIHGPHTDINPNFCQAIESIAFGGLSEEKDQTSKKIYRGCGLMARILWSPARLGSSDHPHPHRNEQMTPDPADKITAARDDASVSSSKLPQADNWVSTMELKLPGYWG